MDKLLAEAHEQVRQLIGDYPELQLWKEQAFQSATNRVLYGARDGAPVVFKYFVRKVRKWQEERALHSLAASGVVPVLYAYPSEDILVMQRLPGEMLGYAQERLSTAARIDLYHQVGAGLARLVKYAARPQTRAEWHNPYASADWLFRYWSTSFEEYFAETLAISQSALVRHQITLPALHQSLYALEAARDAVLAYPIFMHADDIHSANMMAAGDKFHGFVDFEMSRLGNELYLLGAALQWACLDDAVEWPALRAGYEAEQGAPLSAEKFALVKLFAPFKSWIRFAWYWGSDDQPDWVWQGNVRQATVETLVKTLECVESKVRGT